MQKSKFLDSPIEKIVDTLRSVEQDKIRSAIDAKYKGNVPNQIYWNAETIKENEGLSSDPVERTSQRLILSHISILVAQRFFNKFRFIIAPSVVLISMILLALFVYNDVSVGNDTFTSVLRIISFAMFAIVFLSSTALSSFIFQLLLPNNPIQQAEIDQIEQTIKDCVVADLPSNAPNDFKDRMRVLDVDANGRAVSGQVLAKDLYSCALLEQWYESKAFLQIASLLFAIPFASSHIAIAMILYVMFIIKLMSIDSDFAVPQEENPVLQIIFIVLRLLVFPFLIYLATSTSVQSTILTSFFDAPLVTVAITILTIVGWYAVITRLLRYDNAPINERSEDLHNAVRQSGTELLIDKASRNYFISLENAKKSQLNNVINDQSHFIELGKSTGLFASRRDHFAPSESGLPFGLSINDLSTHLFTIGASGSGKTTGVIRPVIKQWLEADQGGMIVLDGKGALPSELVGLHDDYQIITPTSAQFNPIFGLTPDAVADTISGIFADKKGDQFWNDSANLMIRMASFAVYYAESQDFTLNNILNFCVMNDEYRTKALGELALQLEAYPFLETTINYWMVQLPDTPPATKGSIVNNVRTWLGNIVYHKELGAWVDVADGVKIEDAFNCKKFGVLLPESAYGKGGVVINALILRRLYDYAKKRGDSFREHLDYNLPVLLVADEIQNIVTQADVENVTIARSLGLYLCYATQNIDGLYNRLDEVSAKQMCGNFASFIAFATRTKISNEYISARASKIWKATVEHFDGLPDGQTDFNLHLNSGAYSAHYKHDLFRISIGNEMTYRPNRAFSIGAWKPEETEQGMIKSYNLDNAPNGTLNIAVVPLIDEDEIENLLAEPQTAIALINRGRVQRRDVIKLGLMGAK